MPDIVRRALPDRFHARMKFRVVDGMFAGFVGVIFSVDFAARLIEIEVPELRRPLVISLDSVDLIEHDGCACGAVVKEVVC